MSDFDDRLTAMRRAFHRDPETGFDTVRTKARVAGILRDLGVEVHDGGVGVVGILRAGSGHRTIGLRADMDALPIAEASGHDHVSETPGRMHACGHDGHMTMLLGAAERLARARDFDGTVVFLFQPDEEHGRGAKAMIDEGVLSRFPMGEVYAIHNLPGAPVGQISTRVGQICSSESLFEIVIEGQGGHASMPQAGAEVMTVAAGTITALQTVVARRMAPGAGVVVSVTEIETDGSRNVLPGRAVLRGDVRARHPDDRDAVERFMARIVEGIAAAHGVRAAFAFDAAFVEAINAEAPTEAVVRVARAAGLETIPDRAPMSFSEDFARFSAAVPGCFLLLGNGEAGPHGRPLHAADYDFNDALLPLGARFWHDLVRDRLPARAG